MNSAVRRQVETFFSNYPMRRFNRGEILIFAGENPSGIFYLQQGTVRQYDILEGGNEAVVNVFKPPAFFPINYAINHRPNEYFYDAGTDIEAYIAPVDDVLIFIRQNSEVLFDLLARVYNGIDGILRRQVYLMSGNSNNRLLYELILSCHRVGERRPDGAYLVRLSETELAARAGLSRETVNRRIHKLKQQQLILIESGGLLVTDITALERMIGISA